MIPALILMALTIRHVSKRAQKSKSVTSLKFLEPNEVLASTWITEVPWKDVERSGSSVKQLSIPSELRPSPRTRATCETLVNVPGGALTNISKVARIAGKGQISLERSSDQDVLELTL